MKIYTISIAFFILTLAGFAQNQSKIDSIKSQILITQNDSLQLRNYDALYYEFGALNPDSSMFYLTKAIQICEKNNWIKPLSIYYNRKGRLYADKGDDFTALEYYNKSLELEIKKKDSLNIGNSYLNIGTIKQNLGEYDKSLEYFYKSLEIFKSNNSLKGMVGCYINLGITYNIIADYEMSLQFYLKALDGSKKINDEHLLSYIYLNLGVFYDTQHEMDKALEYYNMLIDLMEKRKDYSGLANTYNNIGCVFQDKRELDKALEYYQKSLDLCEQLKDKDGIANALVNIAAIHCEQKLYDKSFEEYQTCLNIRTDIQDIYGLAVAYQGLGIFYTNQKQYKKAIQSFTHAYNIYDSLKVLSDVIFTAEQLANSYKNIGDYKTSLKYYEEFKLLSDSLKNENSVKKLTQMQMQFDFNKQMEIRTLEEEKKEMEFTAKSKRQQVVLYSVLGLLILISFFSIIVLRQYRQKRKANIKLAEQKHEIEEKNEELNQRNEEITAQRDEIETQRDLVQSQKEQIEIIHTEVTQSIDYARRIQTSILSDTKILESNFSDFFVLFKPKDKVSGDFYWWSVTENHTIVAAADCTGHGVPGAFMSMLGISFLREIVNKEYITHPGIILKRLRKEIIKVLNQRGVTGEQKDGMDISLISLNNETKLLQYAGANNPLYLIKRLEDDRLKDLENQSSNLSIFKSSNLALVEIKGDKMPIAIYEKMSDFTNHEIQMQTGDMCYLFSDGFADQFGGEKGKKFKYKPFKQLLLENAEKSMPEQKIILEDTLFNWMSNAEQIYEQVDDIVIVGLKI